MTKQKKELYNILNLKFPVLYKNEKGELVRGILENSHVRLLTPDERSIFLYFIAIFDSI